MLGAIPVVLTVMGNEFITVTEFLHILAELSSMFLSNFTDEDIPKLKQLLVDHYRSTTMNMCPHNVWPTIEILYET